MKGLMPENIGHPTTRDQFNAYLKKFYDGKTSYVEDCSSKIIWCGKRGADFWIMTLNVLFLNWCGRSVDRRNWNWEWQEDSYYRQKSFEKKMGVQ